MAVRLFSVSSSPVLTLNHDSNKGPRKSRLVMMCANNPVSVNLQIRSFKVFEDISTGIVCYKDENGEIICEGYDEGPRLQQQISRFTSNSRDVEIIDLLQRCWLHISEDNDDVEKDRAEQKDLQCNGFKKIC